MAEAFEVIQGAADPDQDSSLEFDDSIQVCGLCGGQIGDKRRPYVFKWAVPGTVRCKWSFALHLTEVEDIVDRVMTELLLYSCTSDHCQCKFQDPDEHCGHCDFVEHDPVALQMIALAPQIASKREFIEEFLRLEPQANPSRILGVFQPIPGFGDRVGWFSLWELDQLVEEVQAMNRL